MRKLRFLMGTIRDELVRCGCPSVASRIRSTARVVISASRARKARRRPSRHGWGSMGLSGKSCASNSSKPPLVNRVLTRLGSLPAKRNVTGVCGSRMRDSSSAATSSRSFQPSSCCASSTNTIARPPGSSARATAASNAQPRSRSAAARISCTTASTAWPSSSSTYPPCGPDSRGGVQDCPPAERSARLRTAVPRPEPRRHRPVPSRRSARATGRPPRLRSSCPLQGARARRGPRLSSPCGVRRLERGGRPAPALCQAGRCHPATDLPSGDTGGPTGSTPLLHIYVLNMSHICVSR